MLIKLAENVLRQPFHPFNVSLLLARRTSKIIISLRDKRGYRTRSRRAQISGRLDPWAVLQFAPSTLIDKLK